MERTREEMYRSFDVIDRWTGDEKEGPWEATIWHPTPMQVMQGCVEAATNIVKLGRGSLRQEPVLLLKRDCVLWMSDTPDEREDHFPPFRVAEMFGGRVLVNGLGLGCFTHALLTLPNVTHIDVVEIDSEVVSLVGRKFAREISEGRLTIHNEDALTIKWPPHTRWSMAWHDIWPDFTDENLPQMAHLHRKYGGRVHWQGSWGEGQCRLVRDAVRWSEKQEAA